MTSALDARGGPRRPRPGPDRSRPRHAAVGSLVVDGVELDVSAMSLRVDGIRTPITPRELSLLAVLMRTPDTVIPRERILAEAWPENAGRNSNTLTVIMNRLRRKVVRADGTSRIRTVRAYGYVFDSTSD